MCIQKSYCYSLAGPENGPKLLFLHGFLGRGADFDPIIRTLSQDFCCLSVDLPGHGETEAQDEDTDYGMQKTGAALIKLLIQLNHLPCYGIGYSMGGRLALYLACRFPQYFTGVLLESASPGLKTQAERRQRREADAVLAKTIETVDWPTFVRRWYAQPLFKTLADHPNFGSLLQIRYQNRPAELARSLRGMGTGTQPSLWAELETLKIPVTLMAGVLDLKFVALNQAMAECCSSAQLKLMPCGHIAHFEKPEAFTALLRNAVQLVMS